MIFIICGPTGSGKTLAAIQMANRYNAPIVNADAFQVYKDMDIGTAKIDKDDPYYIRHHLIDIKNPSESFSVMEYQKLFREKIKELSKEYENIIVCGGTGLYIRASIYDYEFKEEENIDVSDLDNLSNEELFQQLLKIDPKAAGTLHPNNRKRVLRALSIARSGTTKSENIDRQEHKLIYDNIKVLMINPDRELLYTNINQRVEQMFEKGLVEEVQSLLQKYSLSNTARAAIGYKEVIDYLNGNCSLDDCKELIKKRTRNYAKRQVTFFKNQFDVEMFPDAQSLINKYAR